MGRVLIALAIWIVPDEAFANPPAPCTREDEAAARACTMRGDNRCVVRVLSGCTPDTEGASGLLIEAHRGLGQRREAERLMRRHAERFPGRSRLRYPGAGDFWHRRPPPWPRDPRDRRRDR